jgi:hypothetical protein
MADRDGNAVYSRVISLTTDQEFNRIELRPSITADGFTSLYTMMARNEAIVLTVTDLTGRLQWSQPIKLGKGADYLGRHLITSSF